jgi:secreted PhoX family phosphatase
MNHEYTDDGLLHPDGMGTWTAQKVRKAQAAMGVSVIVHTTSAQRGPAACQAPALMRTSAAGACGRATRRATAGTSTLTNNSSRGASCQPGADAANPRANNTMGHIIRWKEDERAAPLRDGGDSKKRWGRDRDLKPCAVARRGAGQRRDPARSCARSRLRLTGVMPR